MNLKIDECEALVILGYLSKDIESLALLRDGEPPDKTFKLQLSGGSRVTWEGVQAARKKVLEKVVALVEERKAGRHKTPVKRRKK